MNYLNIIRQGIGILTRKTLPNEYLTRLSYVNPGWLDKGNIYLMDYAIKNLPSSDPVVEIGSFCGLSTNVINYFISKYHLNNSLINCDYWMLGVPENGEIIPQSNNLKYEDYTRFVKESYIRNINFFSPDKKPYSFELSSDDFFSAWNHKEYKNDIFGREIRLGGKISFCYIDGEHKYEFVKRDFENADLSLNVGGFILFDDSSDGTDWVGVSKLMKEIKKRGNYELILKNPNYLFKKIE
jgi:hypothetical protein